MAIRQNLGREATEIRYPLLAAYCKIQDVEIRLASGGQVFVFVSVYADEQARRADDPCCVNKAAVRVPLSEFVTLGTPTGWSRDEILTAAYATIKAHGYAGEDC